MPVTLLPFLLLLIPIMEIGVFIVVGGEIGVLWTIGLVFFTAVLGTILLRIEGFRTFEKIRAKMNSGEIPGQELVSGAMILVAGVLLLTPGFVTDAIGFGLFIPFIRNLIWVYLASKFIVADFGGMGEPASPYRDSETGKPGIVDLDPDDFHEEENEDSPWHTGPKNGKDQNK